MSSKIAETPLRSAAWRISLWATLAFAFGTLLVFLMLNRFVANDIQRRTDAWLTGEVESLAEISEHTPKDQRYARILSEAAELASKEVPNRTRSHTVGNDSVFFAEEARDGALLLWVGTGTGKANLEAVHGAHLEPDTATDVHIDGYKVPFRVAMVPTDEGGHIYLGVSQRDERRVLENLAWRFLALGLVIVLIGFVIVFYTTRRMLTAVREITEAASRIGQSDLSSRVPTVTSNDEVGQLALTLNRMLDRIENSMHQLHTITNSLAHDLRSPLTAIRGKLEMSLSSANSGEQMEPIVSAIDELDRLSEFLNTSLDVAEARADALRLSRSDVDMEEVLRAMIGLYEPSMSDKGLKISLHNGEPVHVFVDPALVHRLVANLLDNELRHLVAGSSVTVSLRSEDDAAVLTVEDDGSGFAKEIKDRLFERGVKGQASPGHGLGLAFVEAVARAHGGSVTAANGANGGARLEVRLPLAVQPVEVEPMMVSAD